MDNEMISWLLEKIQDYWFWVVIILLNIFSKSNQEESADHGHESDTEQTYGKKHSEQRVQKSNSPTDLDWEEHYERDSYTGQTQDYENNEVIQTFRSNQAQADLSRGTLAVSDSEDLLTDLLPNAAKYGEIWSVCAPKFFDLEQKLYAKVKELDRESDTLLAAFNESLDTKTLEEIHSFRIAALELRNSLQVMNKLYQSLPNPTEMREAFSLMQHDILPFCSHIYRSEIRPNLEFLPLPLKAASLNQDLSYLFGNEILWHFVNYEILADPTLWPLLGRETPYLMSLLSPTWSEEWKEWCHGERSVPLPKTHRHSLRWRVEESLNMWGTQLLGIYLMTLRYGPTGTQALIEELRSHGDLNDKSLILVGAQRKRRGFQTRFAPLAIQMEVSLSTLRLNGYLREADQIEDKWRAIIGHDLKIIVNTGKTIPFPLHLVVGKIQAWVENLHQHTWFSWRDERFESLSGLTLSRGQWGQVEHQAQQVVSADPNLVLSDKTKWVALAYAAQNSPAHMSRVYKAAESLHFDDQLWAKDGAQRRGQSTSSEREDLIAALALADLFSRRSPGQLQRF